MVKKLVLFTAILYTIVLVIVSLINIEELPRVGFSFDDKIIHFIAYFVLAVLWITYYKSYSIKRILGVVFLLMMCLGIVLELIQHQLNPNRIYDFYDLLANCLGVIFGTLIVANLKILKLK